MATQKLRFNDQNREDIEFYLSEGGASSGIVLTDLQLKLLDRWRYADERIREDKYTREQIAKFIMGKYGGCRDTAFRDIVNAEKLFCSTYPLNKQYLIARRIEYLQKKINEYHLAGDGCTASNLEKTLQKYIASYPETIIPHAPKEIRYILNQVQVNQTIVTGDAAAAAFAASGEALIRLEGIDE